tara:strand:- start:40 stop:369 length:330 start_codon:yes stop_codon:yes gene_type:complete
MNTLQNVYDRLSDKTELAKHEVELSLVTDLKETSAKYMPLWLKGNSDYNSAIVNLKAALDIVNKAEQLIIKGQTQVKELGLTDTFFTTQMTAIKDEKTKVTSLLNKLTK